MTKANGPVTRRSLLKAAAAGGALIWTAKMPALAQSSTKLLFMEPFDLALEYLHEMNAVVGGHFKAQGLDVEINNARGTAVAIQQVAAGQAAVSRVGALDLMKAAAAQDMP